MLSKNWSKLSDPWFRLERRVKLIVRLTSCVALLWGCTIAHLHAEQHVFQATVRAYNEPSVSELQQLHFGTVLPVAGANCSMNSDGEVSGQCLSVDGNIRIGQLRLSGLSASQGLVLQIDGQATGPISFSPTMDVDGTTVPQNAVDDGLPTNIQVDASAQDINIKVYGQISVAENLQPGDTYQMEYTLQVNFQ